MTNKEVMQMALDAFETHAKQYPHMVKGYTVDAAQALRAALAQPEPAPVAWVVYDSENNDVVWTEAGKKLKQNTQLYTYPLQREWQGLTEDDHEDFCKRSNLHPIVAQALAEFLEAKIKKNNS